MRASLSFTLPEEKEEHEHAVKAQHYYVALGEFDDHLRRKLKYEELPEEVRIIYEQIREEFRNIINSWDIKL